MPKRLSEDHFFSLSSKISVPRFSGPQTGSMPLGGGHARSTKLVVLWENGCAVNIPASPRILSFKTNNNRRHFSSPRFLTLGTKEQREAQAEKSFTDTHPAEKARADEDEGFSLYELEGSIKMERGVLNQEPPDLPSFPGFSLFQGFSPPQSPPRNHLALPQGLGTVVALPISEDHPPISHCIASHRIVRFRLRLSTFRNWAGQYLYCWYG
ncbi:hypothetical protein CCUS01_00566 [Colletotrichum cuscutae]|uniref:Uncharacterized protein n=1 Tax=Colletotrichum cuscutae TaxID=1209917 RepID=A0AAI9VCN4_9PEZI|nr:hypothetical protein CCUS01_00566 [Colletotrichum cuscutae]